MKPQVVSIVRGRRHHAKQLAANLYPADIKELEAMFPTAASGVLISYENSLTCWSAITKDGVVCMWGISKESSLLGGAYPWLLTTTLIDKYSAVFLRNARQVLEKLAEDYSYLENYVDSRHDRAIRFLRWLGFDISDGIVVGAHQVPFHKFSIRL